MWIGDWQWFDPANIPGGLDWIAFVLGMAGLVFAIVQIMRSKNALAAAETALDQTRADLSKNQLLVSLTHFEEISHALDDALRDDSRAVAERALDRFTQRSAESIVLLESETNDTMELREEFRHAIETANRARAGLFSNPHLDTRAIAGQAASLIRDLVPSIAMVLVRVRNHPGRTPNAD